jgi:hypothetical protein
MMKAMRTNISHFKRLGCIVALLFSLHTSVAQSLTTSSAEELHTRRLDYREHVGYEGWERVLPTHIKAQYAGGMGFLSLGYGWDYGRKCQWETDMLVGVLPKGYADHTHITLTLKQNYIPWSIRCCERFAIEPFSCGLYLSIISGQDYWMHEPIRYPHRDYYRFSSRLRAFLYAGQRITCYTRGNSLLQSVTLYYELSANDLDIVSKCTNHSLKLSDITYFSAGLRFQLFR